MMKIPCLGHRVVSDILSLLSGCFFFILTSMATSEGDIESLLTLEGI